MAWDFETDPEFAEQLAWMREFIDGEVIPLEPILGELPADVPAGTEARILTAELDPDLAHQYTLMHDWLRSFGWTVHLHPSLEADDLRLDRRCDLGARHLLDLRQQARDDGEESDAPDQQTRSAT